MRGVRNAKAGGVFGSLLVLAGCVGTPNRPEKTLFFPAPPASAKIRYEQWIEEPRDLEIGGGLLGLLGLAAGETVGFSRPYAVLAEVGLPLLVADPGSGVVHILDAEEDDYRTVESAGSVALQSPVALARDAAGRIYIADSAAGQVHCMTPDGELSWSIEGVERPAGLALDREVGLLYVSDAAEHVIQVYDLSGRQQGIWGSRGTALGEFNYPTHLALDRSGRLYVSDTLNFRVQVLSRDGRPLRSIGQIGDSTGSMARPKGVAVDALGNVYVADALFDAVQIFDAEGTFLLSIGSPGDGFAEFLLPAGLCVDTQGRIYVADSYNGRVHVFQRLPDERSP